MSNLESIVPPLELCKRIPAGEFEDSALVWVVKGDHEECAPRTMFNAIPNSWNVYPAPTLEEILDEMVSFRASFCVHGMAIGNNFYGYPTSAEEALLMWLKLKGIEVE